MTSMRMKGINGIPIGDRFCATRVFTEQDIKDFPAISRDYSAVHFDDPFSTVKNFRGNICHGLLIAVC